MSKTRVNNVCVGGLIHKASDPSQVFLERKYQYPSKAIDGRISWPGGNWWGDVANDDGGPKGTLLRELVHEEFSLKHGEANMAELGNLDNSGVTGSYKSPEGTAEVTNSDTAILEAIKAAIHENLIFLGAYVITTQGEFFRRCDPNDKRAANDIVSLACYFTVPLNDELWAGLEYLQSKFGNLSSESLTVITSLDEMLKAQDTETEPYKRFDTAWAHGWPLKDFFIKNRLLGADRLELPLYTNATLVQTPTETYEEILADFTVDRVPPKYQTVPA